MSSFPRLTTFRSLSLAHIAGDYSLKSIGRIFFSTPLGPLYSAIVRLAING